MSKRITLSHDDLFCYRLRDELETVELFGEDYLTDYGVDVPDELLAEYNAIMEQYEALQDKLKDIDNKRYNK